MKRALWNIGVIIAVVGYSIFAAETAGPYHWWPLDGPTPFGWFDTVGKFDTILLYAIALTCCAAGWDWLFGQFVRWGWHWFSALLLLLIPFLLHATARAAYITVASIWWTIR